MEPDATEIPKDSLDLIRQPQRSARSKWGRDCTLNDPLALAKTNEKSQP
jgi:hypothetical protein